MVSNINDLALKLNNARGKVLLNFAKIRLTKKAATLVARLFYNPDCIATVNLAELINNDLIKLSDLSKVMITAAPTTLANFANSKKKLILNENDIIDCFATDHLSAVLKNKLDKIYQPEYALSHLLLLGKIKNIKTAEGKKLVEITSLDEKNPLVFEKVLLPDDLNAKKHDLVWHHFGVVVDIFAGQDSIYKKQLSSEDFQKLEAKIKSHDIDFSDIKLFRRDITGRILKEQKELKKKKKPVADPVISKIELPTDSTINFMH